MLSRSSGSLQPARGLSLVELMVGITIGLIVVAGATLLAATQLSENRRLLQETQVQQDLRAAADIVTRDIRRAGYRRFNDLLLWSPQNPTALPSPNEKRGLPLNTGGETVSYRYDRPGAPADSFGFRLVAGTGVIRQRVGTAPVQDLTDRLALEITVFNVQPVLPVVTMQLACAELCADGTQNCWPTVALNDVLVTITGRPVGNPALERTVTSRVRVRNEGLNFNVSPTQVCP